jgi:HPt (histidine-containing phosphotransfer) domain-containing protein
MNQISQSKRVAIDLNDFLQRIGGLRNLVDELLDLFVQTTEPKLGQMEQNIEAASWDLLDKVTHELKGASGNVSATAFHATILEMRDHLRSRKTELLGTDMARLRADFEGVKSYVNTLKATGQG